MNDKDRTVVSEDQITSLGFIPWGLPKHWKIGKTGESTLVLYYSQETYCMSVYMFDGTNRRLSTQLDRMEILNFEEMKFVLSRLERSRHRIKVEDIEP